MTATGAVIWLRMSQLYDYECRGYVTTNVAVIQLRMSQLYNYECRRWLRMSQVYDYTYDYECAAEATNVRPKFSNVPFSQRLSFFPMSEYPLNFSDVPFSSRMSCFSGTPWCPWFFQIPRIVNFPKCPEIGQSLSGAPCFFQASCAEMISVLSHIKQTWNCLKTVQIDREVFECFS